MSSKRKKQGTLNRQHARRIALTDAAIEVVARRGASGLTHRAVDAHARVPVGTTSNHFRTRAALFAGLAEQIDARLRPNAERLRVSARARPSMRQMVRLMQALVERVLAKPSLYLALLELRLEATRQPALRKSLTATLARNLSLDLQFHQRARLPGGLNELVLLQMAFDGVLLDRLTAPKARGVKDLSTLVATMTRRLLAQQ
jgi:DNA-binding transcriptional regulator YbjK